MRRTPLRKTLLTLAAVLVVGAGFLIAYQARQRAISRLAVQTAVRDSQEKLDLALHISEAVASSEKYRLAQTVVQHSVARATVLAQARRPDLPKLAFLRAVESGDPDTAASIRAWWQPPEDDPDSAAGLVELSMLTGDFTTASNAAWDAVERFPNRRAELMRLWYRTVLAEPDFLSPDVHRIGVADGVTRLRTFDVATSVMFRLYAGREIVGLFKPMQDNPWSSYRGEIAAYRICRLINCTISIPHNREARISDHDLARLMGFESVEQLESIERNEYTPTWFTDENGERWLYGTLKAWVPGFVYFPIEEVEAWRYLAATGMTERRLERIPLDEALAGLAESHPEWFPRFLERRRRVSTAEFVHQLSDMHVLDVLINNWDRYSSRDPASNCQWDDGHFVSIDNGASFHTPEEWVGHEVQLRLRRINLFSRSTINAIRWMQPDALFSIAFPPNPYIGDEEIRWRHFLERRQWLLEYVDGLIAERGENAVLIFP